MSNPLSIRKNNNYFDYVKQIILTRLGVKFTSTPFSTKYYATSKCFSRSAFCNKLNGSVILVSNYITIFIIFNNPFAQQ